MSKQFYKYLSNKLIEYLNHNSIKAGERYYIQLDEIEQVEKLYNALKESENTSSFIYKNDVAGKGYETFTIKIGDVNLVVASTINITSGYLVTIRNASKEQLDVWENTALLILCAETLDSIKGGCRDLRKDGMPFSIRSISQNLAKEIETKELSKVDKEIIKFYINEKLANSHNTSLWDYEEVLGIMNKGIIEKKDYEQLGLFVDNSLGSFNIKGIQKRLKENAELFAKVEGYQEYEDKEQQLEKYFDDKGVSALKKDTWKNEDFSNVKKSFEANKAEKQLEYIENTEHLTVEGVKYWEKAKADTASGRRKRHIIVFNNGEFKETTLTFKFDDNLSKDFIPINSKLFMSVSGKKMTIKLPNELTKSSFYRIVYEHKNQSKSKYEFNIAIVNVDERSLANIITNYEIRTGSGNKNRILINNNGSEIKFGQGVNIKEVEIDNEDDILNVGLDETVRISNSSSAWNDENLRFILRDEKGIIPIEIKEENLRSKPINSIKLLKLKRENKENFVWEQNKIKQGTNEFYLDIKLKTILIREKEIINKCIIYGKEVINEIIKVEINLSNELMEAYEKIINYYKEKEYIPSLTYLNDEIISLYKKYIDIYNKEIEQINEKEIISNNITKKDLLKLGVIENKNRIMFSPFAPINIAYSIELYEQLQNDIIESHILERLTPNNLLPYIYNSKNEIYKPIYQKDNIGWIVFDKKENVSIGETNAFVAKVVKEKLNQFIDNFSYLFPEYSNAPIKINVINIKNDKEVVKGVFEYIKNQIVQNEGKIIPIEVRIFNDEAVSDFDKFFSLTSIEKLELEFDINFRTHNNQFDKLDIMRIAFENIKCYKSNTNDYPYAHISFYKMGEDEKAAEDNTSSMESGLSLGGLLSTVTSNNNQNDYRIGFGSKNIIESNALINTTLNINEFASNCYNNGVNPYRKDTSIVTRPLILNEGIKNKLYDSSHWVTFIEPNFGLEYFTENEDNNLIVIHYSDQYTATDHYDTITVTNKVKQYKYIIKEFLKRKDIILEDEKINGVIKSFNSINGEWLLNLIANRGEYDREKLSIISAVKYMIALLDHEDIIWIPISSEEILRVSNAVKLNKSGGIFSLKNLEQKGVHSDDLIFIGVDINNEEELKVYYYPVEVKVGYNFSSTIDKGKIQINKTYELLKEQLSQYIVNDRKVFKNKFFRNFFIKLLLSNAQKLYVNNIWPQKHLERLDKLKHLLLNDNYIVSFELEEFIGKGALISFKKDNCWRSINKEEDILFIELTEEDAYNGIAKNIEELNDEIDGRDSDISPNDLLRSKIININSTNKNKLNKCENVEATQYDNINYNNKNNNEIETENSIGKTKVLLGQAEGSTKYIYWNYSDKELSNRHMIITGKSGNGKTYYIQCAIKELVDQGIPAVIIDYTDGFKPSQLEQEFKEHLGDRLAQFFVIKDKLPINPFKIGQKELDEDFYIDEDPVDVAERFKSIIGSVYKNLGIQQLNSIYQCVIRGINKHGNKFNIRYLREELEEDGSSYAQTALSQLSLLIDKNPFEESKEFEWSNLDDNGGKVYIIQLTGYTDDVKRIITEMILWDLWYYKTQHGRKDKPFTIVLDEAQNLNFGDGSPSKKILLEGRKYGWSAWFATQFLRGQMDKETISSLQNAALRIYFAQTDEEASNVASKFAESNEDKKSWTKKLVNLGKGSCVVSGHIEDSNGKLINGKPVKIKISSLTERINHIK